MHDKKWMICPVCDGEGKHVNPNIDAHGLTAEDFHDDPDFAEDYMNGTYDVQCRNCNGRGSVLTAEQKERDANRAEELSERYTQMCENGVYESGWQDHRW